MEHGLTYKVSELQISKDNRHEVNEVLCFVGLDEDQGHGTQCFEIWSRDHGLAKCGKSFQNENDLITHAKNNHNYCLEHERMWYKCLPCKLREMDDN